MSTTIPATITTIITQLGGPRIFAIAFASSVYDAAPADGVASVTFHIAKPLVKSVRGKATHVTVTLESNDTYTVVAQRVPTARQMLAGQDVTETGRMERVHADVLRTTVEGMTGLALTLGTMAAAS